MGISEIAEQLVASQEGLYCSWWDRVRYMNLISRSGIAYRVRINYRRILQNHFPPTLVYAFRARWQ